MGMTQGVDHLVHILRVYAVVGPGLSQRILCASSLWCSYVHSNKRHCVNSSIYDDRVFSRRSYAAFLTLGSVHAVCLPQTHRLPMLHTYCIFFNDQAWWDCIAGMTLPRASLGSSKNRPDGGSAICSTNDRSFSDHVTSRSQE